MLLKNIKSKERDAILQSLKAGVVPRLGIQYIQVGRINEIQALLADINRITDNGSGIRFIIGQYGSGKTFFLQLVRNIALEKGLVTIHADLNPQRRLNASGGEARSLYTELMRNISTRTKPDGAAMQSIVEKFINTAMVESSASGASIDSIINARLAALMEMVGGYDFASVISSYWKGHDTGNDQLKTDAIRWLRAEFTTKTDARKALGVRVIVDDDNVYDMLKLMSVFVRLAGYSGLMVGLDEMVNLFKIGNSKSRVANYEQILRYLNDSLQGLSSGLLFLMCGTPEFLMDPRKGLYSYEALQSRLAENSFAKTAGVIDYSAPVIRLANLSQEDMYVLLRNILGVFYTAPDMRSTFPEEAIKTFMEHCSKRIGEAYFRTPRNTVKAFVDMLFVLEQNPQLKVEDLIGQVAIDKDDGSKLDFGDGELVASDEDDELMTLKI
ncbi:MAG: ATP-binding protein [Bacteroidetes bacterium]|nr:ATP-binding protein [Bacteroidota bacterium]